MKMKQTVTALTIALVCSASSLMAQPAQQNGIQQNGVQQNGIQQGAQGGAPQVRMAQPVIGTPTPGQPRLGFMGQMVYGYGMRIVAVNYGSPASRLGMERGDVIFSINGRRILSQYDYDGALQEAAMYRGGYVSLTVRNVRYDMGLSYQQFVNVSTVLPGYGMGYPVMGAQAGPVAARSGQRQAQQRAAANAKPRKKIRELRSNQVPVLKAGEKGASQ